MNNIDLINVDYFKKSYYKAILPLKEINNFLENFQEHEIDAVTKTLISLFDTSITKAVLANLSSLSEKQDFLRLIQDNYTSPSIMDFLTDKFPGSEELIKQTIERTLLSAKKSIL
jgi:hypothetical protein